MQVQEKITAACARSGRDPSKVKILAVSKLQSTEKILELAKQGQKDFGENYVQELTEKMDALASRDFRWHMIGHLQRNKMKFVCGKTELIHSMDSLDLVKALDRRAAETNVTEKILLQVNVGEERSKEGFTMEELREDWPILSRLSYLTVHGLMTMPPLQNNAEENRVHFRKLREFLEELRSSPQALAHPLNELSMGTSHDFEVAVEEGATYVRLGTTLFGNRPLP
jgi:hypothetical protein